MGHGNEISTACSTKIQQTRREYISADRAACERAAAQARRLGQNPPPYQPPAQGPPPARGQAPADGNPRTALELLGKIGKTTFSVAKQLGTLPGTIHGTSPFGTPPGRATRPTLDEGGFDLNAWRKYYLQRAHERLQDGRDHEAAGFRNGADTRGDSSLLGEDIRREREELRAQGYADARERFWERVDWAEADRRNGADTHGGSSWTARQIAEERRSTYGGLNDDDFLENGDRRPRSVWSTDYGQHWDTRTTLSQLGRTASLPGDVWSTSQGFIEASQKFGTTLEATTEVHRAAYGPSNDSTINWARTKGSGW